MRDRIIALAEADGGGRGGEVRAGEDRARLLLELATNVTGSLDLQTVLDESLAALRQLFEFGGGAIQLIEGDALVAAAADPELAPVARTVRIPVGTGVSGAIAATGRPIYIPDITVDERVHPQGREKGVSSGVRSYFGAPLILAGAPIGVVQVDSPEVDAFGAETRTLVLSFVPTIAAAVQNARLFEQEREVIERMEEAQRLKDGFVSIVSHELRTPLATTLGFAETLRDQIDQMNREQLVNVASRVHESSKRLQRLIEDLLYAARLQDHFMEVALQPTDLVGVARSVMADERREPNPLELDADEDVPKVTSDADRLHQIITNLVDNAAKFSPDDEPVVIQIRGHDDHVVLAVEDRGAGIPDHVRDRIFDLFYQAEPALTRSTGGLGIGLYVVERLCAAMDAPVTVSDRPGGGTRIEIRLRRGEDDLQVVAP